MQDNSKEKGKGEENKQVFPSNTKKEDKEASTTCQKEQESQKTDREGDGRPASPSNASSPDVGVVRRVTEMLLKVGWVTLTVVGVIVVIGAFLPEVPQH